MLDHPDELSEPALVDPLVRREIFDGLQEAIAALMAQRSRQDLFEKGRAAGLPCAPVNTPIDFVGDVQPRARQIFESIADSDGDPVTIPWRWAHSTAPLLGLRRPAPGLGQHNVAVYVDELGFTDDQLEQWKDAGVV